MTTRDIRTSDAITVCDVCGRTLLRGEHAEIYVSGGDRHSVCSLCTARALHEGWVREGTVPEYDGSTSASVRRRSLLTRLRRRREPRRGREPLDGGREQDDGVLHLEPPPARETEPRRPPEPDAARRPRGQVREPRHVRAIPTSAEQKIASAVDLFNASEHPRTVAGVARSLGMPTVAVLPIDARPSLVNVIASWELCWYRYEVDLSEEVQGVRLLGQGYELEELAPAERAQNAVADENGVLTLN